MAKNCFAVLILMGFAFLQTDGSLPAQTTTKTTGTIVGFVTEKGPAWIEVKADGEEKARRYHPMGKDANIPKVIADTPINARVQLDWMYGGARCNIVKLQVLKLPDNK